LVVFVDAVETFVEVSGGAFLREEEVYRFREWSICLIRSDLQFSSDSFFEVVVAGLNGNLGKGKSSGCFDV